MTPMPMLKAGFAEATYTYTAHLGSDVKDVIADMLYLANLTGQVIMTTFNGRVLIATRGKSYETLLKEWNGR